LIGNASKSREHQCDIFLLNVAFTISLIDFIRSGVAAEEPPNFIIFIYVQNFELVRNQDSEAASWKTA